MTVPVPSQRSLALTVISPNHSSTFKIFNSNVVLLPLWSPTKVTYIQKLENVQNIFTAKIAGMPELNNWERLKKLSLFSLQRRRERYIILHMWKILDSKTSNDLSIEFVFRPRLGNLATIPVCKKSSSAFHRTAYKRSFAVMGPKLWNCIPYNLKRIQDMYLFLRCGSLRSKCLFKIPLQ